jgi:hypothetical protein
MPKSYILKQRLLRPFMHPNSPTKPEFGLCTRRAALYAGILPENPLTPSRISHPVGVHRAR